MKLLRLFVIISLVMYLFFAAMNVLYGEETHVSRGKLLQSLSKYENNKTYRSFVRNRSVGFHPLITVLPQGASLGATAVVSGDRRYVRFGGTPFFSSIGGVTTFNFGRTKR